MCALLFFLGTPLRAEIGLSGVGSGPGVERVSCQHYWEGPGGYVASGLRVGHDVGTPPDPSYSKSGAYICHVRLTKKDAVRSQYLFIGEVGDASYVQVLRVNGKSTERIPVNHGLSADTAASFYTRYWPFVVSIRDLYEGDGEYQFLIKYLDIIPHQAGIRSGDVTLEDFSGVIRRVLTCSPAFTFHVLQIIFFCLLSLSFLVWPKLPARHRLLFAASALVSAGVILQITAIPRTFFSAIVAVRLNDFMQLLSFPLMGASLLSFFKVRSKQKQRVFIVAHTAAVFCAIIICIKAEHNDSLYMALWGSSLLLLGGGPCFWFGYGIIKNKFDFLGGPKTPKHLGYIYATLGALYLFDIVNLLALNSRYYYFNHYLFFSIIMTTIWRMQINIGPNEILLRAALDEQNRGAYQHITNGRTDELDALRIFTEKFATLLGSSRMSIQEVVGDRLRFLGHYGLYKNIQGLHEIKTASLVAKAIDTGIVQFDRMPSTTSSGVATDVVVLPLESNSIVIGVLCATDFTGSGHRLPAFYRERMERIRRECEAVFALLLSEHRNRSNDRLIQMMRNRTHPLQLKSEEYFLNNFDISPKIQSHAFIYGDLVGSVELNEKYKETNAVECAIDEHLAMVWNRFKHLGVVVSRTKGDMISFVVPNQVTDLSEREAVLRCYQVLRYISQSQPELRTIAKKYKISVDLQYRFAMSRVQRPLAESSADASLRSFNLLVDEAIDTAARIVSGVALDGECLILEPAKNALTEVGEIFELEPQRLKGKSASVRLWSLNGNVLRDAA